MGTWTPNAITGAWTLTGAVAVRTALIAPTAFPGDSSVRLYLADPAHQVCVLLMSSKDGRDCIEIGTTATHLIIRQVTRGAAGGAVVTAAGDEPALATASKTWAAVGLAAGTPFSVEVRLRAGVVEVYLNGSTTAALRWQGAAASSVSSNRWYGFSSTVSGAIVTRAQICSLKADQVQSATETLIVACDGNLLQSLDGEQFEVIGVNVFPKSVRVSLAELRGKVYGLGGGNAVEADIIARTTIPWVSSAGVFPGQVNDGGGTPIPGRTRMTDIEPHFDRLVIYGDPQDPQNGHACAIGDAHDWDSDADTIGRAYSFAVGPSGRIGEPIVALKSIARGALLAGCRNSVRIILGDPALAPPDVFPCLLHAGVSGATAVGVSAEGFAVAHCPDGLYKIGADGSGSPLTPKLLDTLITLPSNASTTHYVSVIRDQELAAMLVFLTPITSGPAVHLLYAEAVGGYDPAGGGLFPFELPDELGPTCACTFRGRTVMGSRDGRVFRFAREADTDLGTAISSRSPLTMLKGFGGDQDVLVSRITPTLGDTSGNAVLTVWGGRTAEEAIEGTDRSILWQSTLKPFQAPILADLRAPAQVFQLSAESGRWVLEELAVVADPTLRLSTGKRVPALARRRPCSIAAAAEGVDGPDAGPGVGSITIEDPWAAGGGIEAGLRFGPLASTLLMPYERDPIARLSGFVGVQSPLGSIPIVQTGSEAVTVVIPGGGGSGGGGGFSGGYPIDGQPSNPIDTGNGGIVEM